MTSDLERAFRQMLKSVVREVCDELLRERQFSGRPTTPPQRDQEDRFLLRAREAAKRMAISERHLFKLTTEGVLPCVRVGRLVRYSVEGIEQWIRDSEKADSPEPTPRVAIKGEKTSADRPTTTTKSKSKRIKRKPSTKSALPRKTVAKPRNVPSKARRSSEPEPEEERPNPFRLLLKEMGIDRDDLGEITNGDLMRIAEVDVPTYHGWMYLGRSMPEQALQKLRDHFANHRND